MFLKCEDWIIKENFVRFTKELYIQLIHKNTAKKINIENVVLSIELKAPRKNDYHLGPYFSNKNGEYRLNEHILKVSADAVIQSGLMDYVHYESCKDIITIKVSSLTDIEKMMRGRKVWGLLDRESELYTSKEHLLNKLINSNNHLVVPASIEIDLRKHSGTIELPLQIQDTK